MCKCVLVAEGPDVFLAAEVPDSCEPLPIVAAGNQAWGPLQDQYEYITTELSFSGPPRSLCILYWARVSLCSPGWSVASVPQLQEMLLPLLAKFWVCATFLFYFSFSSLSPSFSPPPSSSLLLPLLFFLLFLMLFFFFWNLDCPGTCYVDEADLIYPHRSAYLELQAWATTPSQIFFLKRFIFVCVCVCIMWVQVVSEATREC